MRLLRESVSKEKLDEFSLMENEANNALLVSFQRKNSGITAMFTHYLIRARVSI
jgi:hypothetical protein